MKQFLLISFFLLTSTAQAKMIELIGTVTPNIYNKSLGNQIKTYFMVAYSDRDNTLNFFQGSTTAYTFSIYPNDVKKIRAAIKKYKKWNKLATKKGITLQKEITKIKVKYFATKSGRVKYKFSDGGEFTVTFFSQTPKKHQLIFSFPIVTSMSNKYVRWKAKTIYFSWKQAIALDKMLSEKNIKASIAKYKKEQQVADEFK